MAAERSSDRERVLVLHTGQPLIGVVTRAGDRFVERIFTSEDDADAVVDDAVVRSALASAGAWSDLDWDDMVETLERIRHSHSPSSPFVA